MTGRASLRKTIISGMIGNGLEWYDYALYAHMAVIIGKLYFPASDPALQTLSSFAVFAVGFVARPFGGLFFGIVGDRFGRRAALSLSVVMMAVATGLIGLLPTHAQIGIAAPILLVVVRIFQGLSIGGEFSGAITYMVEHAPPGRRGIVGSAAMVSLVLGFLTGSLVATAFSYAMPTAAFEAWGWRIPFLIGILIGVVGLYIRRSCDESPVYEAAREEGTLAKMPLREAVTHYPWPMLQAIGIYFLVTMPFYLVTAWFLSFNKQQLGLSLQQTLGLNTACMVAMLVAVPFSAWLSDRYGRRPVLGSIAVAFLLLSWPLFAVFDNGEVLSVAAAQLVLSALVGLFIGPVPAVLAELFPTRLRYTGMAVSYNIAAAAFGGTAPMVGVALLRHFHTVTALGVYVMVAAACGMAAIWRMKERSRETHL